MPRVAVLTSGRGLKRAGASALSGADVWINAQAFDTWGLLPGSISLSDVDPDDDPAINPDHPAAAPWRVTFGSFQGITNSWNGMAFDGATGTGHFTGKGGHNDKWSNEYIQLVLNSAAPYLAMVRPPSGAVGEPAMSYPDSSQQFTGVYSDGRPRACHTYGTPFYWPGVGPGLSHLNALSPGGGQPDLSFRGMWFFNESTGAATKGAAPPNIHLGNGSSSCYDSSRSVVWDMSNGNSRQMHYYSRATDTWTAVGAARTFTGTVTLCYLPDDDCILVGNGEIASDGGGGTIAYQSEAGGWIVFDCAAGTWHTPTFTGAPALGSPNTNGIWPGMCQPCWAPSFGAALTWDNASNTTQILRLTPGANPRTDAWTIDTLPVSGSNSVTPGARRETGTWGRFQWWEFKKIAVLVGGIDEPIKFFRPAV